MSAASRPLGLARYFGTWLLSRLDLLKEGRKSTPQSNYVVLHFSAVPSANGPPKAFDSESFPRNRTRIHNLNTSSTSFLLDKTSTEILLGHENGYERHTGISTVEARRKLTSDEGTEDRGRHHGTKDRFAASFGAGGQGDCDQSVDTAHYN